MIGIVSVLVCLGAMPVQDGVNTRPGVVPTVRQWIGGRGAMVVSGRSRIVLQGARAAELMETAKTFRDDLGEVSGFRPRIVMASKVVPGDFVLGLDPSLGSVGDEGYSLSVGEQVALNGKTASGVFYGTRTLLQMLVLDATHRDLLRGTAIDWPEYRERGFMLDVGRKFFDVKFLRQYVKFMSWYKLNDFQLHLNDEAGDDYSGFRLASDKFPGLANKDGAYTRKQMSDLQDLAAQYHVNITPEIDAPAHARSFTKFRPDLGNKRLPKDHLDLANPETQEFMDSIWAEFIPWFRSPWVHIGADEYNGGPGGAALYKAYINATAAFIRTQGKAVRMWGGLKTAGSSEGVDRDIVVNVWYPGYHDPIEAVKDGYNIINTHDGYLYIVPFAGYYYQFLNTRSLYASWKPTVFDNERLPDHDPHVLGGMFAVWNDRGTYPYGFEDVHELVKPAMPTLGELLWAGHPDDARTYDTFSADFLRLGDGPGVRIPSPRVHMARGDLAFGKVGAASENGSGDFGVQTLFDGRAPSRWIAGAKKPQWASIDLGAVQPISRVVLRWVPHCEASQYRISVSEDGANWTPCFETAVGKGGVETVTFSSVRARYVRLDCLKRGGSEGSFSLFALEVFP